VRSRRRREKSAGNAQLVKVATATEKDIVVTEGEVTAITLKLAFVDPATAAGEGTFKWDIDGVELAQILSMTITDLTDDTTKPAIDLLDDDPDAKAETALDAGFYLVTVTAQKNLLTAASGADIAVWTDVLHVYNGLTTSVKLADADFAYSSNIAGVWVNGEEVTAGTDGSFSYILQADDGDKFTITLTSDGNGAVFVPAEDKDSLDPGGTVSMVFAPYDADATPAPDAVTKWTIEEAGTYTLTINPWPVESAELVYLNADLEFTVSFYEDNTATTALAEVKVNYGEKVPAASFPNDALAGFLITAWQDSAGAVFNADTIVTSDKKIIVRTKAPKISISVNDADQDVGVVASNGTTVALLDDNEGFKITYGTGNYGSAYAYFEVDFGAGKSLQDYPKLTLKWKGLTGDLSSKPFGAWVSGTAFTGSIPEGGRVSQNFSGGNTTENEATLYLYAPAVTGQKAYIALNIWAASTGGSPSAATSYEIYDIAFSDYTPTVVTLKAIPGVAAPVAGVAPVTTVSSNAQYAGTVVWTDDEDTVLAGNFAADKVYTATITLLAKPPYTFAGVEEDFFSVADANTVANDEDSGVVTATFPVTVAPLTSFPITITGAAGATTSVDYTAVRVVAGTVSPTPDGYTVATTAGGNNTLPGAFVIDLGDKTLADFSTVTFTFQGVTGDFGYKRFGLLAASAATGLPVSAGYAIANFRVTKTETGGSGQAVNNQTGAASNLGEQSLTGEIDTTLLADNAVWTAHQIEICFWDLQGYISGATNFKITNIKFNP